MAFHSMPTKLIHSFISFLALSTSVILVEARHNHGALHVRSNTSTTSVSGPSYIWTAPHDGPLSVDDIVEKWIHTNPKFNASSEAMENLLASAEVLKAKLPHLSKSKRVASNDVANSAAATTATAFTPRSATALYRRQLIERRQNISESDLAAARALVSAAQAEAGERNAYRLANPRRNNYRSEDESPDALKRREEDIATYTVNATVASAAILVGEHDAISKALNGTLHKDYSIPEKYRKYTNSSGPPTGQFSKRAASFWMESIAKQGQVPFGGDSSYVVFRNVKDYGAKGDGVTDDTKAINLAISSGSRCGQGCGSSSVKPAIVYFPTGNYLVTTPIIALYNTQIIGNPNAMPIITAGSSFVGLGVISSDVYDGSGDGNGEWYINQSNFLRQIRNLIIDVSGAKMPSICGLHWQVAQATSLQNVYFFQSQAKDTTQVGIFAENGSGGFMSDVIFVGGAIGIQCGNQQFTVRNFVFINCVTAIDMLWDWGWTWKSLTIIGSTYGFKIASQKDIGGSIYLLDSLIAQTTIGVYVYTVQGSTTQQQWGINIDNLVLDTVSAAVFDINAVSYLEGGTRTIQSWTVGRYYDKTSPSGAFTSGSTLAKLHPHTASLMGGPNGGYFERPKPQYADIDASTFLSAKILAKGDGVTDDTVNLNLILEVAAALGYLVYFPMGSYIVTDTILIPQGSKIVGECWSQIVGKGAKFANMLNPHVMVQVGNKGDAGLMEIQDLMFTAVGPTAGIVLMEWNIAQTSAGSVSMWDSHFRIGGAKGTELRASDCPILSGSVKTKCIAGSLMLHLTETSTAYLENVWAWTADHDLDLLAATQLDVYVARGILIESQGPTWLYGTASEHCVLYQYMLNGATDIFLGMIQTESPYYLPAPQAPAPFTAAVGLYGNDPNFSNCLASQPHCRSSWALEIIGSSNIHIAGAGLYNWFNAYTQQCIDTQNCQQKMVYIENSGGIWLYNLYTIGSVEMISQGGILLLDPVLAKDNTNKPAHPFTSLVMAWVPYTIDLPQHGIGSGTTSDPCKDYDFSAVSAADVWKNTGAGEFLDKFIASNGKARIMQLLDNNSGQKHTGNWGCDIVESDKCYAPDNCAGYATVNKPMYIVQTALSWFHDALKIWHEKLQDTGIITSLSILDIVTTFPNPHNELLAEELAKTTKFFSNLNAILGILGTGVGLIPGESSAVSIGSGIIGVAGGVASAMGDSIEDEQEDLTQDGLKILSNRLQNAFSSFQEGLEIMARQVFLTGDIGNWTTALHDTAGTGRTSDLAAFLDGGRYLYSFDFSNVEKDLIAGINKNLVGTQLTTSGYYILRGAHTPDKCRDIPSGTVISNICYTLEFAALGVKEYMWVGERHETTLFSKPIETKNLGKVTETWGVDLADLYTSSYNCQVNQHVYNGEAVFTATLPAPHSVPDCFYSLPVLNVLPDDGKQDAIMSTPCYMWDATYDTDDEKKAHIGGWLPDNLAEIFTDDFCVGGCYDIICTLGGGAGRIANNANTTTTDDTASADAK